MIIVDTGVLYALADRRDAYHAACVRWLASASQPLIVPPPVLAEACYLVGEYLGAEAEAVLLEGIGPEQAFRLGDLVDEDLTRMVELIRQYADLSLGGTDAAVVTVAERLHANRVATVDRRHFSVVRPRHVEAFTLLPERL
ncbi:MAG: type II toxin-antitoxin system VapC family toxin [Nocardioidaceae bacterium]